MHPHSCAPATACLKLRQWPYEEGKATGQDGISKLGDQAALRAVPGPNCRSGTMDKRHAPILHSAVGQMLFGAGQRIAYLGLRIVILFADTGASDGRYQSYGSLAGHLNDTPPHFPPILSRLERCQDEGAYQHVGVSAMPCEWSPAEVDVFHEQNFDVPDRAGMYHCRNDGLDPRLFLYPSTLPVSSRRPINAARRAPLVR